MSGLPTNFDHLSLRMRVFIAAVLLVGVGVLLLGQLYRAGVFGDSRQDQVQQIESLITDPTGTRDADPQHPR